MAEREDQGKYLLRMLHAAQPASTPPTESQDTSPHSEIPPGASSYICPATDVRSAAAGEQYDADPVMASFNSSPYLLPRPGASASTPARSAGADLLRMLQHGTPQSPAQATVQQRQQPRQRQTQQQPRQHPASPSPSSIPRSGVAAEQERFLKNFLAIGESQSTGTGSALFASPSPPPPPLPAPPAAVATLPLPAVARSVPQQGNKGQHNKGRGKERGKGRGQRGGKGRGGGGGGRDNDGYAPESAAAGEERKRSVTPARGNRESSGRGRGGGQQGRDVRNQGGTAGREARKGKKGGGGRGGSGGGGAEAQSPKYAWSAFQNSPDPKSIPIPSLRHFSHLESSPGDDGPAAGSSSLNWRDGMQGSRGSEGDGEARGMQTPPPPPARVSRTEVESRSSAKKAEDDIKRMLRLG